MIKSAVRAALVLGTLVVAGQAAAKDIASMTFAVDTNEEPYRRGAGTITVSDDGQATVEVRSFADGVVTQTVRQLNPAVVTALTYKIQALSNVELKTTIQQFVCMMMPLPGSNRDLYVARGFNAESGAYEGELTMTLTRRGCWSHQHVTPVDAHAVETAAVLAGQLEVLGITYAAE